MKGEAAFLTFFLFQIESGKHFCSIRSSIFKRQKEDLGKKKTLFRSSSRKYEVTKNRPSVSDTTGGFYGVITLCCWLLLWEVSPERIESKNTSCHQYTYIYERRLKELEYWMSFVQKEANFR